MKGLVNNFFQETKKPPPIYGNHATSDIENIIRRSEIELADYELKQGYLMLDGSRRPDTALIDRVVATICAIANNGPNRMGKILIGVTDKQSDADRIAKLDRVTPKKVGQRFVVGVNREARVLAISPQDYFAKWKNAIKTSALSVHLRDSVLSNIDFNDFYGLGVIIMTVPAQHELSYVGDRLYRRDGDETVEAEGAKQIASLAKRF